MFNFSTQSVCCESMIISAWLHVHHVLMQKSEYQKVILQYLIVKLGKQKNKRWDYNFQGNEFFYTIIWVIFHDTSYIQWNRPSSISFCNVSNRADYHSHTNLFTFSTSGYCHHILEIKSYYFVKHNCNFNTLRIISNLDNSLNIYNDIYNFVPLVFI